MGACHGTPEALPECPALLAPQYPYGDSHTYGFQVHHEVETAIACSKETGRPILIMFTGYNNMAVPGLEWKVLQTERVCRLIKNNFVLVVLYVDEETPLDVVDSSRKYGLINTVGKRNSLFEAERYNQNSQPLYVVVDTALNTIVPKMGYTREEDADSFAEILEDALARK
jgi:thiol:disulfide interchange protein DsbD